MHTLLKTILMAVAAFVLGMQAAQAAPVSYTITGDVLLGDEFTPNAFGLTAGDMITATGIFDDSVLAAGTGTINFSSGSGNTMTLNVGTATLFASNDTRFDLGTGPTIALDAFALADLDYLAVVGTNGSVVNFSSIFPSFDDLDGLFGDWRLTVDLTPVPVPAAVWLFGSGLLGLVGIARRRRA